MDSIASACACHKQVNNLYFSIYVHDIYSNRRERKMCGAAVSVLLFVLWSLVDVHSQIPPAPYLTFMGEILPNHSYVDLSLVGGANSGDEMVCHTDRSTYCYDGSGADHGDWYFPDGDTLPFPGNHPLVESG